MEENEALQSEVVVGSSVPRFHTRVSGLQEALEGEQPPGSGDTLGKHGVRMDASANIGGQMC